MYSIENKVAIVVGGLGGIGLAFAKELLRNNVKSVAILDIQVANGELKELLEEFSPDKVLFFKLDMTCDEEVKAAFDAVVDKFKNLDIVINCAGILDETNFERVLNVNFVSVYKIVKMAMETYLPKYKSSEEGIILNLSSIVALNPTDPFIAYTATKTAVLSLGRSLGNRHFYERYKVRLLTICPGFTVTPFIVQAVTKATPFENVQLREVASQLFSQTPSEMAKGLVPVLKRGSNGSVWVCEAGTAPYEYHFPDRREFAHKL